MELPVVAGRRTGRGSGLALADRVDQLRALPHRLDACGKSVSRPELSVPFPSPALARIALGSLAPDPEPRKGGISKELKVSEDVLHVRWTADEARILRVSISSFLEHLSLVVETMALFGPPVGLMDSRA